MKKKAPAAKRLKSVPEPKRYARLIVKAALAEDIGPGDVTTSAIVGPKERGTAVLLAGENMVLAGIFIAEDVFRQVDKRVEFRAGFMDGDRVKKGQVIARVTGRLAGLLCAERVALNFLQRLSGIATATDRFVKSAGRTRAKILDTRKTTPGLRLLEKYAVKAGGGYNHRFGLFDRVLIKDNHIKAARSVSNAIEKVRARYPGAPIEVEVTDLKEVKEALSGKAEMIMLDNMSVASMKAAVKLIGGKARVEASGGVTPDNIAAIAKTGVDFISAGALTHSAGAVDISMEVIPYAGKRKS